MQEFEAVVNGKKFFYREKGEGPVVVLVHGFGEDGAIWQNQYDIPQGFRLLVPDLPGSGRSEMIDDISMEGLASSLHHLLQQLQIDKCIMIGHSMGGYITLAFAENYAEHLNAFGLFHSTAYADSDEKKETRRKGIGFIQKNGAFEFLKTTTPNLYSPATKEQKPELVQQQIEASTNFSAQALVQYYEAMIKRPDRSHVLRTSLPVLFALGRHDAAAPVKDGLEQCHLPQTAYVEIFENSGHVGMREEAEKSNRLLTSFIYDVLTTCLSSGHL